MKKKILFYISQLAGGGAERTLVNIINNLDKNKYDIVLVISENKGNDYIDLIKKDVKIVYLNVDRARYSILRLARVIKQERPSLLFSTINMNNMVLIIANIISLKKIPIIVREANNRTEAGGVTLINKVATHILYNYFADRVISLSNGVKNDLVNNFLINDKKISVIYNPVEIENIQKLMKEKIEDFIISKDEKVIVAVGRLAKQKDFITLIKAFSIICKDCNVRLLILGKGEEERVLKGLCEELKISERVRFMGFKENPYKYMNRADVFVLSSKWEGFGHVIVEAMASGVPVVATDCKSGPGEIIGDDEYGLLVEVGNEYDMAKKIKSVLGDKKISKHYIEKGLERKEVFHAHKITKQYEREIEYLINSNKR